MNVPISSVPILICWLIKNPQTVTMKISDGIYIKTSKVKIKEGYNIIFFNEKELIKFFRLYRLNDHSLEEGLMQIGKEGCFRKILKHKLLLVDEKWNTKI